MLSLENLKFMQRVVPVQPVVQRAGPAHSEQVIASFNVCLTFQVPRGTSLEDSPSGSWWVRYGQLHYYDADGMERVVDAEEKTLGDLTGDFKHPETCEIFCESEDRIVDYWWRLLREYVLRRQIGWYWYQLPSKGVAAKRDFTEAVNAFCAADSMQL